MSDYHGYFEQLWHYIEWLKTLSAEELGALCVAAAFPLYFLIFLSKTTVIACFRKLGIWMPIWYRFIPVLPWRRVIKVKMSLERWFEHVFKISKQSSSGFASVSGVQTLNYTNSNKQVYLGLPWLFGFKSYQPIGLDIKTHMLVVGQSGGGKSVFLKTMLALWANSIVSIDPKGEFFRDIYARKTSHRIVNLVPLNAAISDQLNPFDYLHDAYEKGGESLAIQAADRIALVFLETPSGSKQPYFHDTSRMYMSSLILFVYVYFPKEQHNLGMVRDLITRGLQVFNDDGTEETTGSEAFDLLHKLMCESTRFSSAISGGAAPFINVGQETLGSLRSTLQQGTRELDIPSVRHMLSHTTIPLRELKERRDVVLNIVGSTTSIRGELKNIFRLITNLVMYTFEDDSLKKNGQTLFIGEELNAQGYSSCIEMFLPVLRSMGLSFIGAIQDFPSLKQHYPHTYMSFSGNSDATVWLQTSHPENLSILQRLLGKAGIVEKDKRLGKTHIRSVDVGTTDQLARFLDSDTGNIIVTRAGKRALRLKLDAHHKALPFWAFSPDPDHKEPLLRRLIRFLFSSENKRPQE